MTSRTWPDLGSALVSVPALLRQRRGDYGYDAPRQGLLPTGGGGLLCAFLAALHQRSRHARLAIVEMAASIFLFGWFFMYLHTTRRGKFEVWGEILASLPLRGDEQVLDMGCGRGGIMAMVAKLVPRGQVMGLDLWTEDQSGTTPVGSRRSTRRCVCSSQAVDSWLRTSGMQPTRSTSDSRECWTSSNGHLAGGSGTCPVTARDWLRRRRKPREGIAAPHVHN